MLRRVLAIGLLGFVVAACGTAPLEQAALQVESVAPLAGATDVSADVSVNARFSADVDASSLAGNFTLVSGGVAVEGSVSYAAPFRRATFTPEDPLAPGEYIAMLTNSVRSETGARLGSAVSWGFVVSAGQGNGEDPDPDPDPDPTDPDVDVIESLAFLQPVSSSSLSGVVQVRVQAVDPSEVVAMALLARVAGGSDEAQRVGRFALVDGEFVLTWDTTAWPAGDYALQAVASTGVDDEVLVGNVTVSVAPQLPVAAFVSPSPDKRVAGFVDVEVALEAPRGIRRAALSVAGPEDAGDVRIALVEIDPQAAPVLRDTLSVTFSTLDFEPGAYDLLVELEDVAGNVVGRSLGIVLLPPVLITTPTYGEGVGGGNSRQIVAITIGVNGTILDDYDVTSFDLYINGGLYAADITVNDLGTSTRLAIFEWDTLLAGPGHDVPASGDRMLTVLVTFVDPDTGAVREEFTPGVLVDYQP